MMLLEHSPWLEALRPALGLWVFSALVQTMPPPLPMERWYSWLYNFAQILGANIKNVGKVQNGSTTTKGTPQ